MDQVLPQQYSPKKSNLRTDDTISSSSVTYFPFLVTSFTVIYLILFFKWTHHFYLNKSMLKGECLCSEEIL